MPTRFCCREIEKTNFFNPISTTIFYFTFCKTWKVFPKISMWTKKYSMSLLSIQKIYSWNALFVSILFGKFCTLFWTKKIKFLKWLSLFNHCSEKNQDQVKKPTSNESTYRKNTVYMLRAKRNSCIHSESSDSSRSSFSSGWKIVWKSRKHVSGQRQTRHFSQ